MIPFKCPVCHGTGLVPNGFYRAIGVQDYGTSSIEPENCRSCNASGIVWSPSYLGGGPFLTPPFQIDCTTKPGDTTRVTDHPPGTNK